MKSVSLKGSSIWKGPEGGESVAYSEISGRENKGKRGQRCGQRGYTGAKACRVSYPVLRTWDFDHGVPLMD